MLSSLRNSYAVNRTVHAHANPIRGTASTSAPAARRSAGERQARWRARVKAQEAIYPVRANGRTLDALTRLGWLAEADAGDREKVADAITRLMDDIAREM